MPACLRARARGLPIALLFIWGEHLIARADAAVYDAKRAGRNRVQIASPVPI